MTTVRALSPAAQKALARIDDDDPTAEATMPEWQKRILSVTAEWCTTPPPPRDWLLRDERRPTLDGFLPRRKAGQLIAEGGAGKTMALIQLAIAVASGQSWLGAFSVEDRGRVFMLLAEEDAEEARRRVYNAVRGGLVPSNAIEIAPLMSVPCALLDRDSDGRSIETPFAGELRTYLAASGPWDLFIADPLSRLGGPDCETDNAVATRFVQVIESIVEQTGATALVAHHTNKVARGGVAVTAAASRGSSAFVDGFRWQASLSSAETEAGEVVTFRVTKSNYSRKGEPLLLRRSDDGGRLVPLTAAEQAAMEDALSGDAGRRERDRQREEEREAMQARREEREAAKRAEKEREKSEAAQRQRVAEENALLDILRDRPGIRTDELRAALSAAIGGCHRDRMRDILARLSAAVEVYTPEGGPANARAYRVRQ
jgi:RecA-family ATPase